MEIEFFWADLQKILKYQISWKSVHWETSYSVRTDGQKQRKLIVASGNFANAPNKMETSYLGYAVSDIWWDDKKTARYIYTHRV